MTTGFHRAQQHTHGRCFCATVDPAYNPTVYAIAIDGGAGGPPREPMSAESDRRASLLAARMGEGSALLFYYNQFVVATARKQAKFGTITTHSERYLYR
jgi:hypothetical protein